MRSTGTIFSTVSVKVWISATIVSISLIVMLLLMSDLEKISGYFRSIQHGYLFAVLLFFIVEGIFSSLRIYCFTPGPQKTSDCFRVNAWFVFMLVVLPGRIGEVAVLYLYKRYLQQNTGAAMMNVISQRFLDLIVLTVFFILAVLFIKVQTVEFNYLIIAVAIIVSLTLLMVFSAELLAIIAGAVVQLRQRCQTRFLKKVLKLLLNARTWYRYHLTRKRLAIGILLTNAKWLCNLTALVLALKSFGIDLSVGKGVFLAGSYNFFAIVPLQSLGGIGVSEAGLTSLLVVLGFQVDQAVATSIYMRIVMIVLSICYFLIVILFINAVCKVREVGDNKK